MKNSLPYLAALLLGCALFYLGWSQVEKVGKPFVDEEQTTLVVRPAQAETGWDGAVVRDPDSSDPLGVRYIPVDARELTARRDSWGSVQTDNAKKGGLRTIRLSPPPAKLDPQTPDGTAVKLTLLPDKEDRPRKAGFIRIAPGKYKFLAKAEGHIPKSIDLSVSAGEIKRFTVDLEKIVPARAMKAPASVPPLPPSLPPASVRYPRPPRPRPQPYRPPPRPEPQPQPRFTPVAPPPPPRSAQPAPEPVFTPFP